MDCEMARKAVFEILDGGEPGIPDREVQSHLRECRECRLEAPKIAALILTINRAFSGYIEKSEAWAGTFFERGI